MKVEINGQICQMGNNENGSSRIVVKTADGFFIDIPLHKEIIEVLCRYNQHVTITAELKESENES